MYMPSGMSSKRAAHEGTKQLFVAILTYLNKGEFPPEEHALKLYYLQNRGYIQRENKKYKLTTKGRRCLSEAAIWQLTIPSPPKWDGKWRLVLFDIPVDKRKRRDAFRRRIKELGLVLYQHSVWAYPYPLEEIVSQVSSFYFLSKHTSFITAEKLTGEEKLLKHFSLHK